MQANKRHTSMVRMVELAILTAIIVVLQLSGVAVRIGGTNISLVLIPIALGAMILGPKAGAWLGLVFGVIVYVTGGVMGMDPFTAILFNNHPIITAGICLIKSTLAGFVAGVMFKLLSKMNSLLAAFVAAAITPIINTGVFILGCLTITGSLTEYMEFAVEQGWMAKVESPIYFLFILCAGINFIFEFAVNLVFAPALHTVYRAVSRRAR